MNEEHRTPQRFFGAILIAVGGLIAGLSGACTIFVVGGTLAGGGPAGEIVTLAFMFGVPVFLVGAGLFIGGQRLSRGPKR